MADCFAFLDTNTLLHYRRFSEVDWPSELSSPTVTIIILPTVIDELDALKSEHQLKHIRTRAKSLCQHVLELTVDGDPVALKSNVRLQLTPDSASPTNQEVESGGDDRILSDVQEHARAHPGARHVLVTADTGLTLRARRRALEVVSLRDALLLPDERDLLERQVQTLRAQLADLENNLPNLHLVVGNNSDRFNCELDPDLEPTAGLIAQRMAEVRAKYPKLKSSTEFDGIALDSPFAKAIAALQANPLHTVLPKDVDQYNTGLDSFYVDYERYLPALIEHENNVRRTARLELTLRNDGGAPAEDVDIMLHLPDGFEVFDAEERPEPPPAPKPPIRPNSLAERFGAAGGIGLRIPSLTHLGPPPNVSVPTIKKTNSYRVDFHVRNLKHGFAVALRPLFLAFPTGGVRSFAFEYALAPSNHPKPACGKIHAHCRQRST